MTREEKLDWLYRLRSEIYVYMPKEWLIPMNNALDMAIKALEQEPVLDKIKGQIEDYLHGVEIALEVLVENDPLRPKMEGAKDTLEECLELINKAESGG